MFELATEIDSTVFNPNPLDFPGEGPIGPTPGGPGGLPPIPNIPPAIIAPTGNEYNIINLGGGFAYGINDYGLNRSVSLSFTTGNAATYGNIISVTGTENDTLTIQLTYEEAELIALFGSENTALGWLNDSGVWVNAVDGNYGGTATFVDGPWSSAYPLGTYGINRDTNSVWAIINHNSSFAIIQGVPEPSAFLLSALGSLILFRRRVRH